SRNLANQVANLQRYFGLIGTNFNLSWEIDFWGRYRRSVEAARGELDASIEKYDDVLVTLLGDVASTYTQIRTLDQQLAFVRTNIALQTESLKIAQARFQGGQTTELDVDQAQGDLSQFEALVPQLAILRRQANNRLCILLGVPPEELSRKLGPGTI